jgi:hypothetical protein
MKGGIYLIDQNEEIIYELKNHSIYEIPNFIKVIIDPYNYSKIKNDIKRKSNIKSIEKRLSKISEKRGSIYMDKKSTFISDEKIMEKKRTFLNQIKSNHTKKTKNVDSDDNNEDVSNIDIKLYEVLSEKELLPFFKLHLVNEYSVENILFYEQVIIFKNEKVSNLKFNISVYIQNEFLFTNSLNEVSFNNN